MKVLYEANRLSVRLLRRLIFEDRCEGWKNGPVYVDLWRGSAHGGDIGALSATDRELLRFAFKKLGRASGKQLSVRSHTFPEWIEARQDLSDADHSNHPITLASIRKALSKELRIEADGSVCIPNDPKYIASMKNRLKEVVFFEDVLKPLLAAHQ